MGLISLLVWKSPICVYRARLITKRTHLRQSQLHTRHSSSVFMIISYVAIRTYIERVYCLALYSTIRQYSKGERCIATQYGKLGPRKLSLLFSRSDPFEKCVFESPHQLNKHIVGSKCTRLDCVVAGRPIRRRTNTGDLTAPSQEAIHHVISHEIDHFPFSTRQCSESKITCQYRCIINYTAFKTFQ